jgi:hypothetical protein
MRPLTVAQKLAGMISAAVHNTVLLASAAVVVVHAACVCRKQVRGSLKFILGIPTISSTLGLAIAQQLLGRTTSSWLPDTALRALLQLLLLAVLADFGLYWGEHRSRQPGRIKQMTPSQYHGMHFTQLQL